MNRQQVQAPVQVPVAVPEVTSPVENQPQPEAAAPPAIVYPPKFIAAKEGVSFAIWACRKGANSVRLLFLATDAFSTHVCMMGRDGVRHHAHRHFL